MDWSKLPDLAAVTLLAMRFCSVARRSQASVSTLVAHRLDDDRAAFCGIHLCACCRSIWDDLPDLLVSLHLPGQAYSSCGRRFPTAGIAQAFWMLSALLGTNTLYIAHSGVPTRVSWALTLVAALFGVLPLAIALVQFAQRQSSASLDLVVLYRALSIFLLVFQFRPGNGLESGVQRCASLLFTSVAVCISFMPTGGATAGAFITIAGFLGWASVFVLICADMGTDFAESASGKRSLEST